MVPSPSISRWSSSSADVRWRASVAVVLALGMTLAWTPPVGAERDPAVLPNPERPPFLKDFMLHRGVGEWPDVLFYREAGHGEARGAAEQIAATGHHPFFELVHWTGTFADARPGGDRAEEPGWREYGQWYEARRHLFARTVDGEPWNPDFGHISPPMPLDEQDWPEGIDNATYGDWLARRIGITAGETGVTGVIAADFLEGIPYDSTRVIDYHRRIVAAFADWAGLELPDADDAERARYIRDHHLPTWNDFWAHAYGRYYAALVREIEAHTGEQAMVGFQTHRTPSRRRYQGTDFRLLLEHVPREQIWSRIELQSDGLRNIRPEGTTSAIFGSFAAREPDFVVGAQMSADHYAFWAAVANTWPELDEDEQEERGRRFLDHHWLEVGWTHIATRQGEVRRGAQFFMRHYWDKDDAQPDSFHLIHEHRPTRPFGLAGYYSVPSERRMEERQEEYNVANRMAELRSAGAAVGYYVSDAALDALNDAHAPTGWIVFEPELLTEAERDRLTSLAPIVSPDDLPDRPLAFGPNMTGFGFFDQNDELIVVASHTGDEAGEATIRLADLPDGTYEARDLIDGQSVTFPVEDGRGELTFDVQRWQTRPWLIRSRE